MTTIQTDAQRLQALQDESDRRHILAQKMISGGTPTPAAPSGELPDDYERWDGLREAVSDFRKATYEFARGQRPEDNDTMMAAQRRIFAEARAAVSQAAPEQATNPYSAGIEFVAQWLDKKRMDYDRENCAQEPDTGSWIWRSDECRDYSYTLDELVDDIRALAAPSGAPKQPAIDYTPGQWFDARTLDEMQAFYLSRLPAIREAAKEHGYAIGLHGSERRDFDLIAMQWRDSASDKDTLAHAIASAACGIYREGPYQWETKPSGRFAMSMPICWTDHSNPEFDNKLSLGHIDLSVIEAAPSGAPKQPEPLDFVKALGIATDVFDQYKVDQLKWWKRMDGTPILNDVAVRMAQAFVASVRVQSAPVLPDCEMQINAAARKVAALFEEGKDTREALAEFRLAAQSTPVQVEGQQEPQAHVMPPFAAPASQPDARDPNWLLSTMDGKDWADEFCRMNNAADHGMMLGWFCNAIMTGYDTGRRHEADEQSSTAGAAKGGIDEPNGAVQATLLDVVLHDIELERKRQDDQWGGAAHDDKHTTKEFAQFIYNQISRIGDWTIPERISFIKAAALAVAAVEMLDRKSDPTTAVQALALPVAAAPEQKP